jgi:hypothetical protein
VASFAKHPEFLPWDKLLAKDHPRVTAGTLPVQEQGGKWQDRTQLRFNHAKHLVAVGVWTVPPTTGTAKDHAAHADREQLDCRDCHQADAAGEYMLPINYEQHCSGCHKLWTSEKLAVPGPLPHEKLELVLSTVRERLMQFAEAHPEQITGEREPPLLPNKQPEIAAKDKWDYVEGQLAAEKQRLFASIERGCTYCHIADSQKPGAILPPNMPQRWFPSSRFNHAQHAELSCVACHGEAGETTKLTSQATSDILMPKLQTCQACHSARPATGKLSVRAHCVDCHDYHAPHAAGSGKLDKWLGQKRSGL